MCSKRCAKPVLPSRSFRLPTLYHRFTATTGWRRSWERTTRSPLVSSNRSIGMAIRQSEKVPDEAVRIPPGTRRGNRAGRSSQRAKEGEGEDEALADDLFPLGRRIEGDG